MLVVFSFCEKKEGYFSKVGNNVSEMDNDESIATRSGEWSWMKLNYL